jgi:hypothetical protein
MKMEEVEKRCGVKIRADLVVPGAENFALFGLNQVGVQIKRGLERAMASSYKSALRRNLLFL